MGIIKTTGKVYFPKSTYKTKVRQNSLGATAVDGGEFIEVDLDVKDSYLANLKRKVVEIGSWDMNSVQTKVVAHGLTLANVRTVTAMVSNDAGTVFYPFMTATGTIVEGVITSIDATNVNLAVRPAPGPFDSSTFDDTTINRGWITIEYV